MRRHTLIEVDDASSTSSFPDYDLVIPRAYLRYYSRHSSFHALPSWHFRSQQFEQEFNSREESLHVYTYLAVMHKSTSFEDPGGIICRIAYNLWWFLSTKHFDLVVWHHGA